MHKFTKILLSAAVATTSFAVVSPAMAAIGTGDATADIRQAIIVTKTSDLAFANIVAAGTAETVSVAENGTRTCAVALTCYGTAAAGAFSVAGATGEVVSVSIPVSSVTLTDGGSNSMSATVSTTTSSLTLTGGTGTFKVAGTLNVGANQAAGTYSGQYTVSVNYQ